MKLFSCEKCGSADVFIQKCSNQTGLYCGDCGKWIKWLTKDEIRLVERQISKLNEENTNSKNYDKESGIYGTYTGIPIEHYKPSEGEVIVARYNYGKLPYNVIYKQHKFLQEVFSDNKVITLPQNISLNQMPKQQLKKLLNSLIKTVEELLSCDDK